MLTPFTPNRVEQFIAGYQNEDGNQAITFTRINDDNIRIELFDIPGNIVYSYTAVLDIAAIPLIDEIRAGLGFVTFTEFRDLIEAASDLRDAGKFVL